jgi:prepilin-type N-terminal cleavage/methylation domain-containing protein
MTQARRGFTLVEMLVAITVSTIVLGAAYMLLQNNQRFYRSQSQIVDLQQNLRAVAELLPAELREISSVEGDILAMSSTALRIRAMRGLGIICDTTAIGSGRITLRNSQWFGYRGVDPSRDGILIFDENNPDFASDDRWVSATVSSTTAVNCPDGSAGTRVDLGSVTGGLGTIASVTRFSPVRTFEQVTYRLFETGGNTWLGVSSFVDGAWTAMSEVAGPLRENDGLAFEYFDAAGAATADSSRVVSVRITARARSMQPIHVQGRPIGYHSDSLTVRVALRGN